MEVGDGTQRVLSITPLIDSVSAGLIHVVGQDAGFLSGLDHDLLPLGAISEVSVLRARCGSDQTEGELGLRIKLS